MRFPAAGACAELMLADKKDVVYEGEVKNLLRELLERCCGPHVLSQLLPELTSASSLLYFLLVLGHKKPQQTLGEEYCDVMRVVADTAPAAAVDGGSSVMKNVAFPRQLAWLAMLILPPYIASRSKTGWLNLSQLTMSPRERMAQQLRQRQAAAAGATIATQPQGDTPTRTVLAKVDRIVAQLKEMASLIESKLLPEGYEFSLAPLQNWLAQLHLAAFYVSAKYLQAAKRLASVEYVFLRKDMHPVLNLSLLGYLMVVRLATSAVVELRRIRKMQTAEAKLKLDNSLMHSQGARRTLRVPCLANTDEPATEELQQQQRPSQPHSKPNKKKCALCLGERVAPATTPCGHVFCWECIVGWCQKNKPECPICRQEAHPQQIKCLYNYN